DARQGGQAWEQLSWWFTPIELLGEAAQSMREMHRMSQPRPPKEWAEAQEFAARVSDLFEAAIDGDAASFWRLLWSLQFDPRTGRGHEGRHDDSLAKYPGVPILGDDYLPKLTHAARQYILNEEDHAEQWLGTDRYDK